MFNNSCMQKKTHKHVQMCVEEEEEEEEDFEGLVFFLLVSDAEN